MLQTMSISSSLTWSFQLYLVECIRYVAPHYAILRNLLLFRPSTVKIFSSAPCSQIPSFYDPPLATETKFVIHTKQQAKLQFCIF
jgi:hypothetical protein